MRVAIVSIAPSVNGQRTGEGGLAWYTRNLASRLAARGIRVRVIANDTATAVAEESLEIVPVWSADDRASYRRIAKDLDRFEPDVVHVQHELFLYGGPLSAALFPSWLRKISKKFQTVTTVHGVIASDEIDSSLARGRSISAPLPIIRAVIANIFRRIARIRGSFIVHEETFRRRLVGYGAAESDVKVIPIPSELDDRIASIGAREARRALGIDPDAKVVLSWGFDNAYKGFDILAAGFLEYHKLDPSAILLLGIGPHPKLANSPKYVAAYQKRIEEFGSLSGVKAVGFIPSHLLSVYTAAADVTIFPYRRYLAASGPMAITLGLGRPFLASSVFADLPDVLQFAPSAEGVFEALRRFFGDPQSVVEICRSLAIDRSPERVTDAHLAVYAKMNRGS